MRASEQEYKFIKQGGRCKEQTDIINSFYPNCVKKTMEFEFWLYFYLLIRDVIDQLPDDIIDQETRMVTLCKENVQRMKNGVYLGRMLAYLRKCVYKDQPSQV